MTGCVTDQELQQQGFANTKIATNPTTFHPNQSGQIKPPTICSEIIGGTEETKTTNMMMIIPQLSIDAVVRGSTDDIITNININGDDVKNIVNLTNNDSPRQRQSSLESPSGASLRPRPSPGASPGPSALIPTWTSLSQLRDQLPLLPLDAIPTTLWMCHRLVTTMT